MRLSAAVQLKWRQDSIQYFRGHGPIFGIRPRWQCSIGAVYPGRLVRACWAKTPSVDPSHFLFLFILQLPFAITLMNKIMICRGFFTISREVDRIAFHNPAACSSFMSAVGSLMCVHLCHV